MDKNYHILNTVHTINIWTLLPAGLSPHSCSELFLLWNMDKSIYLVQGCFPKQLADPYQMVMKEPFDLGLHYVGWLDFGWNIKGKIQIVWEFIHCK